MYRSHNNFFLRFLLFPYLDVRKLTSSTHSLFKTHFVFFRYQFFLQVKQDILQGRLPVTFDLAAELGSYVVQCKYNIPNFCCYDSLRFTLDFILSH